MLEWLDTIPKKARLKCIKKIERLREEGHQLRRPEADLLRDKIYELRASLQGIHYRILYFFYGNVAAVVSWNCKRGLCSSDRNQQGNTTPKEF